MPRSLRSPPRGGGSLFGPAVGAAGHIGARAGSRDDNDGFDNDIYCAPDDPGSFPGADEICDAADVDEDCDGDADDADVTVDASTEAEWFIGHGCSPAAAAWWRDRCHKRLAERLDACVAGDVKSPVRFTPPG